MMTTEEALEYYRKSGAILKGHFRLTSGRHADTYMQSAKVFVDPACSEKLCAALVEKLNAAGVEADMVISPAIGGILMGYEVARQMGKPNIFAERENGEMTLRRGFLSPQGPASWSPRTWSQRAVRSKRSSRSSKDWAAR